VAVGASSGKACHAMGLLVENREFLAPFEPVRDEEFFTVAGQRRRSRTIVPSRRVLETNGFEPIGLARRYLQIAGKWRDHLLFQRTAE
jgi:hypothetical protein